MNAVRFLTQGDPREGLPSNGPPAMISASVGRDPPSGDSRTATGNMLERQLDELPSMDGRISRRTVEVAKRVLVDGLSQSETARAMGIPHRQTVHHAVKVVKRALTRGGACKVCGHHQHKDDVKEER